MTIGMDIVTYNAAAALANNLSDLKPIAEWLPIQRRLERLPLVANAKGVPPIHPSFSGLMLRSVAQGCRILAPRLVHARGTPIPFGVQHMSLDNNEAGYSTYVLYSLHPPCFSLHLYTQPYKAQLSRRAKPYCPQRARSYM